MRVATRGEIIMRLQEIYERLGKVSERYRLHRSEEELIEELSGIVRELEEIQEALIFIIYAPEHA